MCIKKKRSKVEEEEEEEEEDEQTLYLTFSKLDGETRENATIKTSVCGYDKGRNLS